MTSSRSHKTSDVGERLSSTLSSVVKLSVTDNPVSLFSPDLPEQNH